MNSSLQDRQDWHETTGQPDWRQRVSVLSDTDVPSSIHTSEYSSLSEDEMEIYRAMLERTRLRQNGEYPGDTY